MEAEDALALELGCAVGQHERDQVGAGLGQGDWLVEDDSDDVLEVQVQFLLRFEEALVLLKQFSE